MSEKCQMQYPNIVGERLTTSTLPRSEFTEIHTDETIVIESSTSFGESTAVLYDGCNIIIDSTEDPCRLDIFGILSLRNCTIGPEGHSPWLMQTWQQSRVEVLDSTLVASGSEHCLLNMMGNSSVVESCSFYGCPRSAIAAYSCSGVSIRNNWIENSTFSSIEASYCSSGAVTGNIIDAFTEYGICIWVSTDLEIENNEVYNGGLHGIIVDSSSYVTISGNTINGSVYDGLYCRRSNNIYALENNVLRSSAVSIDQCRDSVASKNSVHDCEMLRVRFSDNITVSENFVSSSWQDGISVMDSDQVSVINNRIEDAGFEGIGGEDISRCVFNDNTVLNAGFCGIYLNRAEDISIGNNSISSPACSGIDVERSTEVIIESNMIEKTGHYGINLSHDSDLSVIGNIVNETTEACVLLYGSERGQIFLNALLPASSCYADIIYCTDIAFNNVKYGNYYKCCSCNDDDAGLCDQSQFIANGIWDEHPIHDLAYLMTIRKGVEPSPPTIDVQTLTLEVVAGVSEVSVHIADDSDIEQAFLNISYDEGVSWRAKELHHSGVGVWSASIDSPTMSGEVLAVLSAIDEYGNTAITDTITLDAQLDLITLLKQDQLIGYLVLVLCALGVIAARRTRIESSEDSEMVIPLSSVHLDALTGFLRQLLSNEEMLIVMTLVDALVEDVLCSACEKTDGSGWRTRNQIMEETGLTKRYIYYDGNLIDKLTRFCFVEIRESPTPWGGQTHQFRVNTENQLLAEIVTRQVSSEPS